MKKYELTGEIKLFFGIELKRIKALRDIGDTVKAGELGGYVQSEANLSHDGNAWVSGNARVSGDAQVYGNARVYGDAWVSGNARVSGDARVYGNAWESSPLYIQGTKYAAYMFTANKFAVGCQRYTFDGWHKFWRKIAERHGFTEADRKSVV